MSEIYHERQSFMFCAIHTLNNLFQCEKTKSQTKLKRIKDVNFHFS